MAYDYIFKVGADASGIAQEITKQMENAQSIMTGQSLIIKFTGDPKSAQDLLKQIQGLKPDTTVQLQIDKKNVQKFLAGFDKNVTDKLKIDTDKLGLKDSLSEIFDIAGKGKLKDVNLTEYFSEISRMFLDPTKSADELAAAIKQIKGEMEALSSISNSFSLRFFSADQLKNLIKTIQNVNEAEDDLKEKRIKAGKKQDEYQLTKNDIRERINKKRMPKKMGVEQAEALGISADKYESSTAENKELMIEYAQVSKLLDQMIAKKKDFSEVKTTADAESYLKETKEIFDVYKRLETLQQQVKSAFKIKDGNNGLLLGQFNASDIIGDLNNARQTYIDKIVKTEETAARNANKNLEEFLQRNAQKQADKAQESAAKTAEKAQKNIEKRKGGGSGSGTGSGTGTGTGGDGSVAGEYRDAAEAADGLGQAAGNAGSAVADGMANASEAVQKLRNDIAEAEAKLAEMQNKGVDVKSFSKKDFRDQIYKAIEEYDNLDFNKIDEEELDKRRQHILDMFETYKRSDNLSGSINDLKKSAQDFIEEAQLDFEDYNPKVLKNIIDKDAINNQITLIEELKTKLREAISSSGGEGGSGTVGILVDKEQALQDINDIKQQLESIPEKKEIQIEIKTPNAKSTDFLNKMKEIDSLYGTEGMREYAIAFNPNTGYSSSIARGSKDHPSVKTGQIVKEAEGYANSIIHTHPERNVAAFSVKDIQDAYDDFTHNITQQFIKAGNEVAHLDMGKLIESGIQKEDLVKNLREEYQKGLIEYRKSMIKTDQGQQLGQNYAQEYSRAVFNDLKDTMSSYNVDFDQAKIQPILNEAVQAYMRQVEQAITSGQRIDDLDFEDKISDIFNQYAERIKSALNIQDDVFKYIDSAGNKRQENVINAIKDSFIGTHSDLQGSMFSVKGDTDQKIYRDAFLRTLSGFKINPSDVFKTMNETEWMQSIYPSELQKPIQVKVEVDTKDAESKIEGLTKDKTIKLTPEIDTSKTTDTFKEKISEQERQVTRPMANGGEVVTRSRTSTSEGSTTTTSPTVSTEGIDRLNSAIDTARDNAENLKRDLANVTEGASGTQQQQGPVPDWISQEESALDNLKSKIANEIPTAIETKNNAFNNEMGVVQNAVMGEVECFNLLEQKLSDIGESIAALDMFFSEMGSSSSAFDGLHQNLSDVGESLAALDTFFSDFKDTTTGLGVAKDMGDSIKNLKVNDKVISNITDLSAAIELLGESFKKLSEQGVKPNAFSSINDLLQKGEQLKDLAKILSATQKERQDAAKQAGINTNVKDSDTEKYLANLAKYYDLQDKLNQRSVAGKETQRSIADIEKEAAMLREIEEYETKINNKRVEGQQVNEKEEAALRRRKELEKEVENRNSNYIEARKKAEEERSKGIKESEVSSIVNEIDKFQERINSLRDVGVGSDFTSKLGEAEAKLQEIKDLGVSIENIELVGEDDISKAKNFSTELSQMLKNLEKNPDYMAAKDTQRTKLQQKAGNWLGKNTAAPVDIRNQVQALYDELGSDVPVSRLQEIASELNQIDAAASKAGQTGKSFAESLKGSFGNLARYLMTFASFYRVIGVIKQAVSTVRELDTALTEMRKVSDESVGTLKDFQIQSFGMGDAVGTTALQIQKSTADWLRLGETFDEAKQSAQESTILLNVSEFQNIDDATQSLVSMSQAYKELDKIDIIDKLNNIGNNFSISTDQLATGLQNAAAVLKTQGNDLDQSIALLTAGNAITQDVSKTSAGIRTISLRISGTEEAKNEIQDMGEDIDDFVVRTKSKTDQIIRDYTAVASNAYKGVSVLDENGNLRSTYDILLDIAEVYEEIQKTDKETGQNRAQALVETLAGKNRSNIAASILSNPEMLKEVYETSKQSQGSAQQELDKYLDSVEGHISRLQNRLQELAAVTIDSEWLKDIVDLGTGAIKVITQITKAFGGLNSIIGVAGGLFLQKSGFGLLNYNKYSGEFGTIFSKIGKGAGKALSSTMLGEMQQSFESFGTNQTVAKFIGSDSFNGLNQELKDYITNAEEAGHGTQRLSTFLASAQQQSAKAASGFSKLGEIGMSALSTLGTMALVTAASWAIGQLISALDDYIHRSEIIIQKGQEAQSTIDEINKDYESKATSTDTLGKRYNELRGGVRMNGDNVENVSLSTAEYEEFLSVNKELATIYPQLISGTTAQGDSLVDLGSNAEAATKTLQEYLQVERDIANYKIAENIPDLTAGIIEQNKLLEEENKQLEFSKKAQQNIIDKNDELNKGFNIRKISEDRGYSLSINSTDFSSIEAYNNQVQMLKDTLDELDIYATVDHAISEGLDGSYQAFDNFVIDVTGAQMDDLLVALAARGDEASREAYDALNTVDQKVKQNARNMEDNWRSAIPSFAASLKTSKSYQDLSEISDVIGNGIIDALNNIDYQNLSDENKNNMMDYIRNEYVYSILDAIDNADNKEQMTKAIEGLFQPDFGSFTNEDMRSQVNELVSQIFPDDEAAQVQLKVALGFEYYDENGKTHWKHTDARDRIFEALGGTVTGEGDTGHRYQGYLKWEDAKKLTQDQIKTFNDALDADAVDLDTIKSYEDLINVIKELQMATPEIEKTGTLADLFNNEDYKEKASTFESQISSVNSVLDSLRENGELTSEEMKTLQESFPDLTEFTEAAISDKGFKQLSDWIKEIRTAGKEYGEEGIKQAKTYIDNLMGSVGLLADSYKDVRDLYLSIYAPEGQDMASAEKRGTIEAQFLGTYEQLKEQLAANGEEINMDVVARLIALDEFSGPTEEILSHYRDEEVEIKLVANQRELDQLDREIENISARRSTEEAKNAKKQAEGGILSPSDYVNILSGDQEAIDKAIKAEKTARNTYGLNQLMYGQNSKKAQAAYKAYMQRLQERYQAEQQLADDQAAQIESGTNLTNQQIEAHKNNTDNTQQIIDQNKNQGKQNSQELYDALQKDYEAQAELHDSNVEYWTTEAAKMEQEGNASKALEYTQNATTEAQNAQSAREAAQNAGTFGYTNEQLEYQKNALTEIQNQQTEINDLISLKQAKGLKVTGKEYKAQANLSKQQIANLKTQNREMQTALDTSKDLTDEQRRQYENDIAANKSAINSAMVDIENYNDQARNLALTNAQALAGAVSSALGEMATETGLTTDTIKTLTTQFSDLADSADISSIFYNTADGVKVDVVAMQRLAEAERDIASSQIQGDISTVQDMIKNLGADGDTTALQQYQDELARLSQQQSEVFAQYQAMMDAMNQHGMIELADQTKNAGAEYDKGIQYLKEAKEMWDKGLIGTDDFKERAKYFDAYGRTDAETFKSNYDRLSKYFNEKHPEQGIVKFWDDLVANGLAMKGDGGIVSTFTDIDAAAQKMGMSLQAFEDTLLKTNDYGSDFVIVKSMEDAMLQTKDLNHELAEAQAELTKMQTTGAPKEAIEAQQKEVQAIKDRIGLVDQARQNMEKSTAEAYKTGLRNFGQYMDAMKGYYAEAEKNEDYESMAYYAEQMQAEAGKYGIELDAELNFDPAQVQQKINEVGRSGSFEVPLRASDFGYYSEGNQDRIFESGQQQIAKNREEVEKYAEALKGLNYDQLNQIQLGNGQYDVAGLEAAEDALEHIATAAGLSQEQVGMLVPLLASFGLIDFSTPATGVDEFNNSVTQAVDKVKELQANGTIKLDFDIDDNNVPLDTLENQITQLKQQRAKITPDTEAYAAMSSVIDQKESVLRIRTEVEGADNAQAKLQELQNMSDEDLAAKLNVDVNSDEFQALKADIQNMSGESLPLTVHIQDDQMSQLTSTERSVTAQVAGQEQVQELKAAIDQLPESKNVPVKANVTGTNKVNELRQAIINLPMQRVVNVVTNMVGATAASIIALRNAINSLQNKTINVTTVKSTVGNTYTGTMFSPAASHAIGTVRKIEKNGQGYNVLNLKPIGGAHAKGSGDISLDQDEESLVNELGQESVIRDGKWFLLPAGMHVEQLKKGDKILCHITWRHVLYNLFNCWKTLIVLCTTTQL